MEEGGGGIFNSEALDLVQRLQLYLLPGIRDLMRSLRILSFFKERGGEPGVETFSGYFLKVAVQKGIL